MDIREAVNAAKGGETIAFNEDAKGRLVVDIPQLAESLHIEKSPNPKTGAMMTHWTQDKLADVYEAVKPVSAMGKDVLINGAGPAWLMETIVHAAHPANALLYDPKIGDGVAIRRDLEKEAKLPSPEENANLKFTVVEQDNLDILSVDIEGGVFDYQKLGDIKIPALRDGVHVVLDGRMPSYLSVSLAENYAHTNKSISFNQPNAGLSCAVTHSPEIKLGTVITDINDFGKLKEKEEKSQDPLAWVGSIVGTRTDDVPREEPESEPELPRKAFIVPCNDGESAGIIDMLEQQGFEEGKDYFVTKQTWGASWNGLEVEVQDFISSLEPGTTIYGVELQGEPTELSFPDGVSYANVDHHSYTNDDRSNELSSIEQVALLIGVELTVEQQFIAANDKSYIPGMRALAEKLGMSKEEADDLIEKVRWEDRHAQGITPEQELQATEALKHVEKQDNGLTVVHLAHSKCATITDQLFGQYDNLFIICGDGELDFFGDGKICQALQAKFEGWSGGNLPENGYWCGYVSPETVKEFIDNELNKEIAPVGGDGDIGDTL